MKTTHSRIAFAWLAATLLFTGCGGGGGSPSGDGASAPGATYTLSGQVQKGPFAIGSQISVHELDRGLNPTGKVYGVQTTDDLGNFAVSSQLGANLVEIVANGFYMDELTGQLASSQIQLRAIADLSVNAKPTVNVLTSLQALRLKTLFSQGKTYAEANSQSQNEVLAAFGIDATKVNTLSNLFSMQINGSTDADAVLLATSVTLSQLATHAALANGTTQPAELSNYINSLAAEIAGSGAIANLAFVPAKNLAQTQINLAAVRANLETYYANRGVTFVAPKFEEWVDYSGSGTLPRRPGPASGFMYVANESSNDVSVYAIDSLTGALSSIGKFAAGTAPWSVAVDPTGQFVYVTNANSHDISAYSIAAGTGLLTSIGTFAAGTDPGSIAVTPDGRFAYVTNWGGNVLAYAINSTTGALASIGTVSASGVPAFIAVDPTGKFAYTTNNNTNNVTAYLIDTVTGTLTNIGTVACPLPADIAFDPAGKSAYVPCGNSTGIVGYSITATTGALTSVGTFAMGARIVSITIDATGKFAYTVEWGDLPGDNDSIATYSINADTGALTKIDTLITNPRKLLPRLMIDPSGKFAYARVENPDALVAYSINATTKALTNIGAFGTVTVPGSFAITRVR